MENISIVNSNNYLTEEFCKDLFLKITNGEESIKLIKLKKKQINEISNYFENNYDFTPLTLSFRHSYYFSNIEFILYLLSNSFYFNIFYRNIYGNGLFEFLPFFIKNLKIFNKFNQNNQINIKQLYNKDLQSLFNLYKNKIEEFSYINKFGNTFLMNVLLTNDSDYINFILDNINNIYNNLLFNNQKLDFLNILNINHNDLSIIDIISNIKFNKINNFEKNNIWKNIAKIIKKIYLENKTKKEKIINSDFFTRININNQMPILNLCKNTNIKYFVSEKYCNLNEINFNKCFFKNIDFIDNFNNNCFIYTIKNKLPIDVILYIKKGTSNFSLVNNKNESIFYLLCKFKYFRLARDILENNNCFESIDIYPQNKPNILYFILKNNLINLKNNSKDLIFNYFKNNTISMIINYGNNKIFFENLNLSFNTLSKNDFNFYLYKLSKKKNKTKYNFIMRHIFIIKYKSFFIENNILTNELFSILLNYLFDNII